MVHNHDFFDSYLEAVLSRGDLLLFLNREWPREMHITRMVTKYRLSAHITVTRYDWSKNIFIFSGIVLLLAGESLPPSNIWLILW